MTLRETFSQNFLQFSKNFLNFEKFLSNFRHFWLKNVKNPTLSETFLIFVVLVTLKETQGRWKNRPLRHAHTQYPTLPKYPPPRGNNRVKSLTYLKLLQPLLIQIYQLCTQVCQIPSFMKLNKWIFSSKICQIPVLWN